MWAIYVSLTFSRSRPKIGILSSGCLQSSLKSRFNLSTGKLVLLFALFFFKVRPGERIDFRNNIWKLWASRNSGLVFSLYWKLCSLCCVHLEAADSFFLYMWDPEMCVSLGYFKTDNTFTQLLWYIIILYYDYNCVFLSLDSSFKSQSLTSRSQLNKIQLHLHAFVTLYPHQHLRQHWHLLALL